MTRIFIIGLIIFMMQLGLILKPSAIENNVSSIVLLTIDSSYIAKTDD